MNGAASIREPTWQVSLRSIFDICALVDELDPDSAGELVVGSSEKVEGVIFLEGGRVCWAAARGLARRLTELLILRAGIDTRAMEAHYVRCKKEGSPFGEWLVDRGILSATDLRWALLEHTLESMQCLCSPRSSASWRPRKAGGYNARFTFHTSELLAKDRGSVHVDAARRASEDLVACFSEGDWGIAFVRGSAVSPEPIAIRGACPDAAATLIRLGKWALSMLDVAHALHHEDPFFAVRSPTASDRALVAFPSGSTIIAGETDSFGPARIMNHRAKKRRLRG